MCHKLVALVLSVLIVVALCEVGLYDDWSSNLSIWVGFRTLSYVVRCCRSLPNSLEKEVYHFLPSLWYTGCRRSVRLGGRENRQFRLCEGL